MDRHNIAYRKALYCRSIEPIQHTTIERMYESFLWHIVSCVNEKNRIRGDFDVDGEHSAFILLLNAIKRLFRYREWHQWCSFHKIFWQWYFSDETCSNKILIFFNKKGLKCKQIFFSPFKPSQSISKFKEIKKILPVALQRKFIKFFTP
jgi:hypothetical protein